MFEDKKRPAYSAGRFSAIIGLLFTYMERLCLNSFVIRIAISGQSMWKRFRGD